MFRDSSHGSVEKKGMAVKLESFLSGAVPSEVGSVGVESWFPSLALRLVSCDVVGGFP